MSLTEGKGDTSATLSLSIATFSRNLLDIQLKHMFRWNFRDIKLAKGSQYFTFWVDGFLTLQLQENIFQGCPGHLKIHNPLQEAALEVAEQICRGETARLSTRSDNKHWIFQHSHH